MLTEKPYDWKKENERLGNKPCGVMGCPNISHNLPPKDVEFVDVIGNSKGLKLATILCTKHTEEAMKNGARVIVPRFKVGDEVRINRDEFEITQITVFETTPHYGICCNPLMTDGTPAVRVGWMPVYFIDENATLVV